MIDHIQKFIEKPNPVFDNMPICPFVNKFRQENQILYKIYNFAYSKKLGLDSKILGRVISEFQRDKYHEVMIVIWALENVHLRASYGRGDCVKQETVRSRIAPVT